MDTTTRYASFVGRLLIGLPFAMSGFGKLASVRISREQVRQLQVNLVRSHACGVGHRNHVRRFVHFHSLDHRPRCGGIANTA